MFKSQHSKKNFYLRRAAAVVLCFFILVIVLSSAIALFAPLVLDRLERQRDAQAHYNCKHYGPAMNKYYGREVCEAPEYYEELASKGNQL